MKDMTGYDQWMLHQIVWHVRDGCRKRGRGFLVVSEIEQPSTFTYISQAEVMRDRPASFDHDMQRDMETYDLNTEMCLLSIVPCPEHVAHAVWGVFNIPDMTTQSA